MVQRCCSWCCFEVVVAVVGLVGCSSSLRFLFVGDVVGVDVVSVHVVVVERIVRTLCDQNALGRRPIL